MNLFQKKKKSHKDGLSHNVLLSTLGMMLLRCIPIFTTPIITRLLPPAAYGDFTVYNTWVSLLIVPIGMQTYGTLMNARMDFPEGQQRQYHSSVLFLSTLSFLALYIPFLLFPQALGSLLKLRPGYVYLLAPQSFACFCVTFLNSIFVSEKRMDRSVLLNVLSTLGVTASSLFLALSGWLLPIDGYTIGYAGAYILIGFAILLYVLLSGKVLVNRTFWKYALPLCLPLILHGGAGLLLGQSDQLMMRYISGEESVGLYAAIYGITTVLSSLWTSFNSAWGPFYYDSLRSNDLPILRTRVISINTTFTMLCIGFVMVYPEVVRLLLAPAYWQSMEIVPLLVLGHYFVHLYSFPAGYEFYHRKTKWVAVGTILAALLNIGLNLLWIPLWQGFGAALATAISYFALLFFHDVIARHAVGGFPMSWKVYIPRTAMLLVACAVYYLAFDLALLRWIIACLSGGYLVVKTVQQGGLIE